MTDANKHGGQHGGQQGNGPQGAQSMHNTPADAAAHERDVTHALRLTQEVQSDPNSPDTQQKLADIASILQSIDARTDTAERRRQLVADGQRTVETTARRA
jgi:hypothetical protein